MSGDRKDSPEGSVVETARLRLRRFTRDDLDALLEVFADPDARRFYPEMIEPAAVAAWIERNLRRYEEHGFGLWAMIEKESGRLVGDAGLSYQDVEGVPELDVGYHVLAAERRKGYATEGARACLDRGFRETAATVIGSIVSPANAASRGVAGRIHANVREFLRPNGVRLFYFTRRDEWERR
ncbi:MAG TPA: GNAT family N-acetyltransferase [Acidobacteriota bacterium]|nr:GNAT family N-acetyltransferase [Acidobacteriota bacterium]